MCVFAFSNIDGAMSYDDVSDVSYREIFNFLSFDECLGDKNGIIIGNKVFLQIFMFA